MTMELLFNKPPTYNKDGSPYLPGEVVVSFHGQDGQSIARIFTEYVFRKASGLEELCTCPAKILREYVIYYLNAPTVLPLTKRLLQNHNLRIMEFDAIIPLYINAGADPFKSVEGVKVIPLNSPPVHQFSKEQLN